MRSRKRGIAAGSPTWKSRPSGLKMVMCLSYPLPPRLIVIDYRVRGRVNNLNLGMLVSAASNAGEWCDCKGFKHSS